MYIVYMTICLANNKKYIGVHKTLDDTVFDGYLGSGVNMRDPRTYKHPKTPFQYAVKEFGFKNFKRTTLARFNNKEDAYKLEAELVNREWVQDPETYNKVLGGYGGSDTNWNAKTIYVYNSEGEFVSEYPSTYSLCETLNVTDRMHVSRAVKQGYLFHGFQLSYEKLPYMKKYVKNKYIGPRIGNITNHQFEQIPIGRFDYKTGELLEVYSCLTECRKAGYENAKKVIIGERKKCKGCSFRYLNEEELSNINIEKLSYKELHTKINTNKD